MVEGGAWVPYAISLPKRNGETPQHFMEEVKPYVLSHQPIR